MTNFIVNLHAQVSYEYEIEANSIEEAIQKAKDISCSETLEETNKRVYDFDWLESDVYPIKDETFDFKGSIFDKGNVK